MKIERVIAHWTAGTHKASELDKKHYHFIFEGDGRAVRGNYDIADNISARDGKYAAHTLNCNTGSAGVAVACMHNAKPGAHGKYPMTREQFEAMVKMIGNLCITYNIKVTPRTVLWHAEVEQTLGIKQRGKWDATELSFAPKVRGARNCGDYLRAFVEDYIEDMQSYRQALASPLGIVPTQPEKEYRMNPLAVLDGYKTYIVGVIGLIVGVAEFLGYDVVPGIDKSTAWTTIQVALTGMFLKRGQTVITENLKK